MTTVKYALPDDIAYLESLYMSAFPENERKKFSTIIEMRNRCICNLHTIWNDDQRAGLAFVIKIGSAVLLDYLAIDPETRGKGIGSQVLKALCGEYESCDFYIEIEDPEAKCDNREERTARRAFYLKNGFVETGDRIRLFGIRMNILSYNAAAPFDGLDAIYREIYGGIYNYAVQRIK